MEVRYISFISKLSPTFPLKKLVIENTNSCSGFLRDLKKIKKKQLHLYLVNKVCVPIYFYDLIIVYKKIEEQLSKLNFLFYHFTKLQQQNNSNLPALHVLKYFLTSEHYGWMNSVDI